MIDRKLGTAAILLAGLATSSVGVAYNLTGYDWSWQNAPMSTPFYLNPTSFPSSTGTLAQVRTALENGQGRWGADSGAAFSFNYGGESTSTALSANNNMVAAWSNTTASGGTLAVAQYFGGFGGRMDECDIRFYAANGYGTINWKAQTNGVGSSYIDVEQVATHEFGHCAGLDHSGSGGAVMYSSYRSGTVSNRQLSQDDKDGMIAMYGAGSGGSGTPTGFAVRIESAIVAGQTFNLNITGAPSNRKVFVAVGLGGEGDGPCFASLGGNCVDIVGPIYSLGSITTNADGEAVFPVTPPVSAGNATVAFQVAVVSGPNGAFSFLSDVDSLTVAPAGTSCQSGWITDCNGICTPASYIGDTYCDDGETVYNDTNTGFNGASDYLCNLYEFDQGDCAP